MGGNIPGGSFLGDNILGVFSWGETFSSCNVSILIFPKMVNKYNKIFNIKIYALNSPKVLYNLRDIFSHNFLFQWARNKALKAI